MATGRASLRADSQIPYCKDQGIPYIVGAAVNGVSLVTATIEMPADGVINFADLGLPNQAGTGYQVHIANHAAGAPAVESGAEPYAITNGQTLTVKVDQDDAQTATVNGAKAAITCGEAEPYAFVDGDNLLVEIDEGLEQEVELSGAPAAVTSGATEPFALANGQTLLVTVNGTPRTTTFAAVAANETCANAEPYAFDSGDQLEVSVDSGGAQLVTIEGTAATALGTGGGPFALVNAQTLLFKIDREAVAQQIDFLTADFVDIGAATAAEVAFVINRDSSGCVATVSGSDVRITSRQKGTGSYVEITGGTAQAEIGLALEETQGTGDAADLAAVTADELVTLVNADTTGITASKSSSKLKLTSDKIGTGSHVQVHSGAMNTPLAFDTNDHQGTGDAADIGQATAAEVAAAINLVGNMGTYVLATVDEGAVVISTLKMGTGAALQFTGGTANGEMEFDTDAHAGTGDAADLAAMTVDELVIAVNDQTTGVVASKSTDKLTLTSDSLGIGSTVQVMGGSMNAGLDFSTALTRGTGDAHTLAAVTAAEIAAVLNTDIIGAVATVTSDDKVRLRSKTVGESGYIEVTGGTANGVVGFSTSEVQGSGAVSAVAISDRAVTGFTLSGPEEGDELDILVVGPIAGQLS